MKCTLFFIDCNEMAFTSLHDWKNEDELRPVFILCCSIYIAINLMNIETVHITHVLRFRLKFKLFIRFLYFLWNKIIKVCWIRRNNGHDVNDLNCLIIIFWEIKLFYWSFLLVDFTFYIFNLFIKKSQVNLYI